jgi:GNAT superfamily N-acetyltransferase
MDGLSNFNAEHITVGAQQKVAIAVRDASDEVVAGLLGQTYYGWLYVGWLWTSEPYRNRGIGTELMKRAEPEARERGCHHGRSRDLGSSW